MAQINSAVNERRMPPASILRGSCALAQIQSSSNSLSKTLSEAQLYDYGIFRVRQQLSTVAGTLLPAPYGGKSRQIMVDLDQDALIAKGLSPIDVSNAINAQNVTLPSGSMKIGDRDYTVSTNASPAEVAALNDLPVKLVNGAVVYIRDIGQVRDGSVVQQNAVRTDNESSVLLTIMKTLCRLEIIDEIIMHPARRPAPPRRPG
jgi:multidrug efflux pump subunit AcrB